MGKAKQKTPEQQAVRLARRLLPAGVVVESGDFVVRDVSDRSEADQRHTLRSQQKETVRRLTRIEKLHRAGILEKHEAQACQWYADAYALGYDTLGITANYGASGGGGCNVYTHLSRYKAQQEARADYAFARAGIPDFLVGLFDQVVLEGLAVAEATQAKGRDLAKFTASLRLAANKLHERIAHVLPIL